MEQEPDLRHTYLLAHAVRLVQMMYQLNVTDLLDLVIDDDQDGGTPYHHLGQGLLATLKLLGTSNKEGFYEGLVSGMKPQEALDNAIKYEDG